MYFVLCTCMHTPQTTPHHTTHLPDDSGVFLYTRQYMTCGEHHHFTEQSNLNGLLHLCQSLQDLLKYCWVPLGGRDKGLELEQCADAFKCVCMCTCKWNTILHVPCICHVTSCETHPTTIATMSPSSHHAPVCLVGGGYRCTYIHTLITNIIHTYNIWFCGLVYLVDCGNSWVRRICVWSKEGSCHELSHCNGVHIGRSTGSCVWRVWF